MWKLTLLGLVVALAFCIMSLICAIVLGLFDRRAETRIRNEAGEKIHLKDIIKFPMMFWLVVIICVTFYVNIIPFVGISMYVPIILFIVNPWHMHCMR